MQNYTRIPIMFLRDTGLFERKNSNFYLTNKGLQICSLIKIDSE